MVATPPCVRSIGANRRVARGIRVDRLSACAVFKNLIPRSPERPERVEGCRKELPLFNFQGRRATRTAVTTVA